MSGAPYAADYESLCACYPDGLTFGLVPLRHALLPGGGPARGRLSCQSQCVCWLPNDLGMPGALYLCLSAAVPLLPLCSLQVRHPLHEAIHGPCLTALMPFAASRTVLYAEKPD